MKVVSIFSGIGGLDKGFESAGFDFCFANEWSQDIADNYKKNLPNVPIKVISFRDINWDEVEDFDGVIGAPAIAPIHLKTPEGESSIIELYYELLEKKQPKFVAFGYDSSAVIQSDLFTPFTGGLLELYNLDYLVSIPRKKYVFYGIRKDLDDSKRPMVLSRNIFCEEEIIVDDNDAVKKILPQVIPVDLSYKIALAIKEKLKI